MDRRSVALERLEEQPSDAADRFFLRSPAWVSGEQMACHLTRTTTATHRLIRDNLHLTPIYGGLIDSKGPRYCPSIEDKIVRFADKESHQIFLEPEGRDTPELYVQGFSTGLPERLQLELLRPCRPGAVRDAAARLRGGLRHPARHPAQAVPGDQAAGGPVLAPASSTAPPATRRPLPRVWWPASTRPIGCGA